MHKYTVYRVANTTGRWIRRKAINQSIPMSYKEALTNTLKGECQITVVDAHEHMGSYGNITYSVVYPNGIAHKYIVFKDIVK